ncbi:MAG: hypothetical protein M9907_08730 [Burkholderiaceae bacterium]|nr:hypothetical protein [Burkholderiaceae bacterium]
MSQPQRLSDEMQSAFVDGQLDARENAEMLERMGGDPRLRDRVCRTRLVKEMVRAAYRDAAPQAEPPGPPRRRRAPVVLLAIAVLAALVGWQAHDWLPARLATTLARVSAPDDPVQRAGLVGSSLEAVRQASANHVLVHIASSDTGHVGPALDGIEGLLRDARAAGRPVAVEVIANIGGIDLLRVGASPYPARIAALQAAYPELSFIACGQTLERLRERGATVQLLPGVRRASSALDQVVRRLQEGWVYVKA